MSAAIVADTGGLLKAIARTADGRPSFPEFARALTSASLVIVPALVLAEIDYFLRAHRGAMRKLVADIFDPHTRYEYEVPPPADIVHALEGADSRWSSFSRPAGRRRWWSNSRPRTFGQQLTTISTRDKVELQLRSRARAPQ